MAVAARTYWSDKVCTRCGTVHEEACPTCDIKGCKNRKEHPDYTYPARWKTGTVMTEQISSKEMSTLVAGRTSAIRQAKVENQELDRRR